jgi:hypothetical protein
MRNEAVVPCAHAMNEGEASGCLACLGSGWAGLRGDGLFG